MDTYDDMELPLTKDVKQYSIFNLSDDHDKIALSVIDAVWKLLGKDSDYKPLRATVIGSGGSVISCLTNKIVTWALVKRQMVIKHWGYCIENNVLNIWKSSQ